VIKSNRTASSSTTMKRYESMYKMQEAAFSSFDETFLDGFSKSLTIYKQEKSIDNFVGM
jgi:hypothetical protein